MKAKFWVKLIFGLAVIALMIALGYYLVRSLTDFVLNLSDGGGYLPEEEVFVMETPEPMPTMPAYMGEDSFYDNAGSVQGEP